MINALQKIATDLDKDNPIKDDFLIHLLEIFVQLGLQSRKLSEKTHSKVGLDMIMNLNNQLYMVKLIYDIMVNININH